MDEAVDERGGSGRVREDAWPFTERQVGREHETFPFIPSAHDLKEEIGGARVVGQIPDLIDQEQAAGRVVVEAPGQAPGRFLTVSGKGGRVR